MTTREKSPSELVLEALELLPRNPLEAAALLERRGVSGCHHDGRIDALAVYVAARLGREVGTVHVHRFTVELLERGRGAGDVTMPAHAVELADLIRRGGFEELEGEPSTGTVGPLSRLVPAPPAFPGRRRQMGQSS